MTRSLDMPASPDLAAGASPVPRGDGTLRHLGSAVAFTLVSVVIFGLLYPLLIAGIARVAFPSQAEGSLLTRPGGTLVGSDIVGQSFTQAKYFQGRPSAAGKNGYDPTATGGTNLAPTSKKLIDATRATIASLQKANPNATEPVPMDLVTSSGSGIDPDISPEAALYEAPRVATARHLELTRIRSLVQAHVHGRELGFLGEPHVNVLELNLALDAMK